MSKKTNNARQIAKIYNYLVSSNVISGTELLKESGVRQFTRIFKQTPVRDRNILIQAFNINASHLSQVIHVPTLHNHLPRVPSAKAFKLVLGTNKAKNPKTIYKIKMMKFDHKSGYRDPALSMMPKYKDIPGSAKFNTTNTPGWENKISDALRKPKRGTPLELLEDLEKACQKFLEHLRKIKIEIDSTSDHWDKMVLWYATYISEKGPEGFCGYEITWELVGNTIAEMGKNIVELAGAPNKFAMLIAEAYGIDNKQGEATARLEEFSEAIEKWVLVEHPKGKRIAVNLGVLKNAMAAVKAEATGNSFLKGIGNTQLEEDIKAVVFAEGNPLEEVTAIGAGYLDLYNEIYNATFALLDSLRSRRRIKQKALSVDKDAAWENRIYKRWKTPVEEAW